MNRIRFHPLALKELHAAARWCDRQRPGLGSKLVEAVEGTLMRIRATPQQGTPYLFRTRRFILKRFPYSTVYLAVDPLSHVVAIAHHRRAPGYWRRRLRAV